MVSLFSSVSLSPSDWSLVYISGSVLTFSVASLGYTYFARLRSPLWLAIVKNMLALGFTLIFLVIQGASIFSLSWAHWPFMISGFIGLGMADLFLLGAFKKIGPGRSLILFAFQPVITGLLAYGLWGEAILPSHGLAIVFFILCLVFFSQESLEQKEKGGEMQGLLLAVCAVTCDATGVMLTKHGFYLTPEISALKVNGLRLVAALFFLLPAGAFFRPGLISGFLSLTGRQKPFLFLVCFSGAFLSLVFYMEAIRYGQLAVVTSAVLADPMIATALECVWLGKRPSRWLIRALVAFLCAVACLVFPLF